MFPDSRIDHLEVETTYAIGFVGVLMGLLVEKKIITEEEANSVLKVMSDKDYILELKAIKEKARDEKIKEMMNDFWKNKSSN